MKSTLQADPLPDLLQDIHELAVEYFTELSEMAPEPEIITWDGRPETLSAISNAIRVTWCSVEGRNPFGDLKIVDYERYENGTAAIVPLHGRIRIDGETFSVLPPEVKS